MNPSETSKSTGCCPGAEGYFQVCLRDWHLRICVSSLAACWAVPGLVLSGCSSSQCPSRRVRVPPRDAGGRGVQGTWVNQSLGQKDKKSLVSSTDCTWRRNLGTHPERWMRGVHSLGRQGAPGGICCIKRPSSCHIFEKICLWSTYTSSHPPGTSIDVHKHLGSTFPHRETFPGRQVRSPPPGGKPEARATRLSSDQAQEICFALGNSSCSQAKPDDYLHIPGAWGLSVGEALELCLVSPKDKLRCPGILVTSPPGLSGLNG